MSEKSLSPRNVQAIISGEDHKVLRDEAYIKGVPLRDLIREILVEYAKRRQQAVLN